MRSLYVISINDSLGRMQSYGITASTMALAVAEACRRAGVPDTTEPQTAQRLHTVDAEVA